MLHRLIKSFRRKRGINKDIDPDEIFLDSKNLPDFDNYQFEGRIEKPISHKVANFSVFVVAIVGLLFFYKLWDLQISDGQQFRARSENNSLDRTVIYANRGVIYDRNKFPIVWNTINQNSPDYSLRVYSKDAGLSTLVGYIKYPLKDSKGIYYSEKFEARDGLEKLYDYYLSGHNGTKIIETDVKGFSVGESTIDPPLDGENLYLSIDLDVQKRLKESLLEIANRGGFKGGSGIIMDVKNGEILAVSNFPEYSSQIMTDGSEKEKISSWLNDKNYPFLNRAFNGLYTPGSIIKLFVALGVLEEGVISPTKQILSTGSISVPNPFFPDRPSVFMDWKAHGFVDMRRAIAVSSNIYFYAVGGGFEGQKGIGIDNIEKYTKMFGFGEKTNINFPGEKVGTIPSPEWKAKVFKGEPWRVGDTYNTAIGQYGFQVSPVQAVRAVAAIANEGKLLTPTFVLSKNDQSPDYKIIDSISPSSYKIVKEGMRMGVTLGTSQAINFPFVEVASKTGTAQIGIAKEEVNSWVVGFWPYKEPRYAYAIVMERGSKNNQFGAVLVMQELLGWMGIYKTEYLK